MEQWYTPNPQTPGLWSLFAGSGGRTLVIIAACAFALSVLCLTVAPRSKLGAAGSAVGVAALWGALSCLAALFVVPQFQYRYVWSHCDLQTPLAYRLAAVWSGQEGSFLLWASCTALFGWVGARSAGQCRRWYTVAVGVLLTGLSLTLVFLSPFEPNSFDGVAMRPMDGVGLAPALLNYWVTIHPPILFLGFGALVVPFALSFAALATGDLRTWIAPARTWALVGATLVGLGLCLGGFWAYETLGWGGFWAWDPVENVSFVPWMLGLALVHGLRVQAVKGRWVFGNLLLGAAPFLAFVYGTYLTRSGLLAQTSVHSFEAMQSAALRVLLAVLVLAAAAFATLWIVRWVRGKPDEAPDLPKASVHREAVLRYGVILLVLIGLVALAGMTVPAIGSLTGKVLPAPGEETYQRVLVWFFVPLMILLAVAPFVGWAPSSARSAAGRVYYAACLAFGGVGLVMFLIRRTPLGDNLGLEARHQTLFGGSLPGYPWTLFYFGLCLFALLASAWRLFEARAVWRNGGPAFLAHTGVAILLMGMIVSRSYELTDFAFVQGGRASEVLGLRLQYAGETSTPTDRNNKVRFQVEGESRSFTASPGLYYHPGGNGEWEAMTWPHIERFPLHDVYFSVQPVHMRPLDGSRYVHPLYRVDVMMKPLTGAVWLGAALVAVAGLLAAFRRRTPTGKATAE